MTLINNEPCLFLTIMSSKQKHSLDLLVQTTNTADYIKLPQEDHITFYKVQTYQKRRKSVHVIGNRYR